VSTTVNWTWHIVAAILGVLFSLSIVYKKLENWFSVHQPLKLVDVKVIVDKQGRTLSPEQVEQFVRSFNAWTFLGRNTKYVPDFSESVMVELVTGVKVYCARGEKFIEVKRVNRKGKAVYYWLLDTSSHHGGTRSSVHGDVL
jgi:uncharacterized protein YneF (UPF0154 family)